MGDRSLHLVALVIVLLTISHAAPASAQVSPGPLSRAHASLEGIRHCRDCHGGSGSMDAKCLECHAALAWTLQNDRGLHAREGRNDCAKCHPEHGGVEFSLVDWGAEGREGFDHTRTGLVLDGAHSALECDKCHRDENRIRAVALRRPEGSGTGTWLALDPACRSCHEDVHEGRLGPTCQTCHTTARFTPVPEFDHARTGYPLRGKHAALECAACHRQGRFGTTDRANATRHLAPIPHEDCASCHRDVHAGRFGATCARCHVESGFREVATDRFDHDRTRYPLRGAHLRVSCARCHDPNAGDAGSRPAFAECRDCHRDPHAGTATLAGADADCAACHTVQSFVPSTFTVAQHATTHFALEGRHAVVPCASCHRLTTIDLTPFGSARVQLRPPAASCTDCHAPAHGSQPQHRLDHGACGTCHDVQGWLPSIFTIARHDSTAFPLQGAHAAASCRTCHGPDRPGLRALDPAVDRGRARIALSLPERACQDCHRDVHRGRYVEGGEASHLGPCARCHDDTRFVPSTVDTDAHDAFGFRLEGAHRAAPCTLCHRSLENRPARPESSHALVLDRDLEDVVLWDVPRACQDCHRPGGQQP